MKNIKQKNKYPAFSIIEVLASLFLFSAAIIGTVSLMSGEIWKSIEKRNEAIAGQLSQEGIELVRNIRDNNWVKKENAFEGFDAGDIERKIDYTDLSLKPLGGFSSTSLYLSGSGFYSHSSTGSSETVFNRKIIINSLSPKQKEVFSMVAWNRDDFPAIADCEFYNKCFYVKTVLSNDWGNVANISSP